MKEEQKEEEEVQGKRSSKRIRNARAGKEQAEATSITEAFANTRL